MALPPAAAADAACEPSDDDERLLLELLADPEALELELELSQDSLDDDALTAAAANYDSATTVTTGGDPGALITKAVAAAITRRRRPASAGNRKRPSAKAKPKAATSASATLAATAAQEPEASSAKKLLKYNSNKARDERREELLYLRRKVAELEMRLAEIRIAQPSPAAPQLLSSQVAMSAQVLVATGSADSREGEDATPQQATTAVVRKAGVWEEISGRQHELRMQAERENIRLKLVLESQVKIAKSLEKLLKKTASAKEFGKYTRGERVHFIRPPPSHHKDAELFGNLLADVEKSYAEVDQVFDAVGLKRLEPPRIDARVQRRRPHDGSGSHHVELQVFGSKVMPFDMHATGLAVWNHYVFAKERTPNRFYCHNQAPQGVACDSSTEDTILENFNMEVDVSGTLILYCMKLVLRRYVEPSRVVVVWRAFFDPTQVANEPLSGVRFLEKGYVVVKKMDDSPSTADGPTDGGQSHNLLQTCFISTPVSIGDLVHAEPSKVGALTDLVLRSTAANVASSHQMIENVLLEQAMARGGR